MGYDSYFNINVKYPKEYDEMANAINKKFADIFVEKLYEATDYLFEVFSTKEQTISLHSNDMLRWNNYQDDLIRLSEIFTGALIECDVNGEGDDDFQELVFKDGKHASSYAIKIYWSDRKDREAKDAVLASAEPPRPLGFLPGVT